MLRSTEFLSTAGESGRNQKKSEEAGSVLSPEQLNQPPCSPPALTYEFTSEIDLNELGSFKTAQESEAVE